MKIYQFKIILVDIEPLIWRRIQVPENYTFRDLHVAIQDAMGWWDYHLHAFTTGTYKIGIPEECYGENCDEDEIPTKAGWKILINDYFVHPHQLMHYEYDFGDSWEHIVHFETVFEKERGVKYRLCCINQKKA